MSELSSSAAKAVVWDDVSKVYPGGHQAVQGVSLSVARGEVLALLGTSGSGKTTLLKMVNALIEPSSGRVVVRDRCTTEWDPIALRRSIGYVIQEGGLMPHLSVLDNVALAARVQGARFASSIRWRPRGSSWLAWTRRGSAGSFPGSSAAVNGSEWESRVHWRPALT